MIEIEVQSVITFGAVLSVLVAVFTLGWKLYRWIDHQKEQDKEIAELKRDYEVKIQTLEKKLADTEKSIREKHNEDQRGVQEELQLLVYGIQACLKGLAEQGCDGPVSDAIDKIEKHINKKAHN